MYPQKYIPTFKVYLFNEDLRLKKMTENTMPTPRPVTAKKNKSSSKKTGGHRCTFYVMGSARHFPLGREAEINHQEHNHQKTDRALKRVQERGRGVLYEAEGRTC